MSIERTPEDARHFREFLARHGSNRSNDDPDAVLVALFLTWLREIKGYILCLPHEHNNRCYEETPYTYEGPTLVCGHAQHQATPADVDEAAMVKEFLER